MSNKLSNHMKKDTIKWIAVTMAILLIGVALAAALTNGFRDANPYCWLGHTYEKGSTVCSVCGEPCEHKSWQDGKCKDCGYVCEHDYKNGKCTICGESEDKAKMQLSSLEVGSVKENGIKLMSSVMPMALDTVKVTATVEPADAVVDLKWELSGISSPTNYIDMQVAVDKKSATLSAKKAFGSVITLKVSSAANTSASATCTLNYIKRLNELGSSVFSFGSTSTGTGAPVLGNYINTAFDMQTADHSASKNMIYIKTDANAISYSEGTMTNVLTFKTSFKWNEQFLTQASSIAPSLSNNLNITNFAQKTITGNGAELLVTFDNSFLSDCFKSSYVQTGDFSDMRRVLNEYHFPFTLTIEVSNGKETVSGQSSLKKELLIWIDPESFSIKAGSIQLDHSNIDF